MKTYRAIQVIGGEEREVTTYSSYGDTVYHPDRVAVKGALRGW